MERREILKLAIAAPLSPLVPAAPVPKPSYLLTWDEWHATLTPDQQYTLRTGKLPPGVLPGNSPWRDYPEEPFLLPRGNLSDYTIDCLRTL